MAGISPTPAKKIGNLKDLFPRGIVEHRSPVVIGSFGCFLTFMVVCSAHLRTPWATHRSKGQNPGARSVGRVVGISNRRMDWSISWVIIRRLESSMGRLSTISGGTE